MSDTPPMNNDVPLPMNARDRTPELTSKREKRSRDDEDDDRSRSGRHERNLGDDNDYDRERERERERRHRRHRDDREREREDDDEERRERRRRHREHREDETEEEREARRERRRREREERHRDRDSHRDRDRSRESHRSSHRGDHRHEPERPRERDGNSAGGGYRELSREEKERERERRDREMQEERREAARQREERYGNMDRDRDADRRRYRDDRPPPPGYGNDNGDRRGSLPPRPPMSPPPPRRRRDSPSYDRPPPPGRGPPPPPSHSAPKDPVVQLLEEVDRENRSVFVSQIASRLTSQDLGDFFVDKLGKGAVRDARVVTDKVSRRSKGIGYVELDTVELLNQALSLSGTIVMGIPISIKQTESERNREGQMEAAMAKLQSGEWEREEKQRERQRPQKTFVPRFPPLSTGLSLPPGLDVDAHKHASIPYHRLYITSLAYSLTSDDVVQVFEAFGPIEFVDLHKDHQGQSKGSAYVQFQNLSSAQMALDAMDNFELAGRTIRVTAVEDRSQAREIIEDTSYAPRMDANARRDLMHKLARTEPTANSPAPRPPPPKQEQVQPTPYLLVANMFNPDEETERNWDLDMAEDIKGEVESKYGPVKRIKVDKMSRGDVYIEFDTVESASKGHAGLGGRFFGGRQLTTAYITEGIFRAHL